MLSEPWMWWLAFGFALLIIEMLSGTFFFLCLAPAAFATAAVAWLVGNLYVQWICFAAAGCLALAVWYNIRRGSRPGPHDAASSLNNRTRHLIGRKSVLVEPVTNGQGRINIDDSWWQVSCSQELPAGAHVRVTGVHEMILTIEKQPEEAP